MPASRLPKWAIIDTGACMPGYCTRKDIAMNNLPNHIIEDILRDPTLSFSDVWRVVKLLADQCSCSFDGLVVGKLATAIVDKLMARVGSTNYAVLATIKYIVGNSLISAPLFGPVVEAWAALAIDLVRRDHPKNIRMYLVIVEELASAIVKAAEAAPAGGSAPPTRAARAMLDVLCEVIGTAMPKHMAVSHRSMVDIADRRVCDAMMRIPDGMRPRYPA